MQRQRESPTRRSRVVLFVAELLLLSGLMGALFFIPWTLSVLDPDVYSDLLIGVLLSLESVLWVLGALCCLLRYRVLTRGAFALGALCFAALAVVAFMQFPHYRKPDWYFEFSLGNLLHTIVSLFCAAIVYCLGRWLGSELEHEG